MGMTRGRILTVPAAAHNTECCLPWYIPSMAHRWSIVQINAKGLHGSLVSLPNLELLCSYDLSTALGNTGTGQFVGI